MKKSIHTVAAALALASCAAAFAQAAPPEPMHDVIQLGSSASVDVVQDLLSIVLVKTMDGPDPGSIQAQLKSSLEQGLSELRNLSVAEEAEVHTGGFSLQPRYGREGKIANWVGSAELVLEGRDFTRLGTMAVRLGGFNVSAVNFGLSRRVRSEAETQAQAQAIAQFRQKAGDIARSFGFQSYTLREVSITANEPVWMPRPRLAAMEMKSAGSETPLALQAGKTAVTVQVSGSVQLR